MPDAKLCECGCEQLAPIARKTRTTLGHVKGEPIRFIRGHAARGKKFPPWSEDRRRAASLARRGRKLPPEHCRAISESLRGEKNPSWRGGRHLDVQGYVRLANGSRSNRPLEHRVVMAYHIGRELLPGEQVHHANDVSSDNRRENLWLFPDFTAHMHWHWMLHSGRELTRPMAAVPLGHGG